MSFRENDAASECFNGLYNMVTMAVYFDRQVNSLLSAADDNVPLKCRYVNFVNLVNTVRIKTFYRHGADGCRIP